VIRPGQEQKTGNRKLKTFKAIPNQLIGGRIRLPVEAVVAIVLVIVATTFAPIAIRAAQLEGVPSIYIIAVRLLLTALVLGPIVLPRDATVLTQLRYQDWLWVGLAAIFLTVNLLMLFLALEYTSVLVTGILRRITPIWVIGLEILFLTAAFHRHVWVGLLITVVGSITVALGSTSAVGPGSAPVFGALLAIIGSICMGFYLLIGRKLHKVLPSLTYSWVVFTLSGLLALVVVLVSGVPLLGYSWMGYV
jgi:drug/metabolite transporter (DMT)-like permease